MTRTVGLLVIAFLAIALQPAHAADNPLIGSWRWDNDQTLLSMRIPTEGSDELMESAKKARKFVEGLATKLRSNTVLSYTEHECTQTIFGEGGGVVSRETFPYELVEVRNDVIVIDQLQNGGVVRLFRDGPDRMYVEVAVGSFTYKDYFTREK